MDHHSLTAGAAPTWHAVSSSRIGAGHLRDGTERQDRLCVADVEGHLVVAAADGVGSSRHSAWGAEIATRTALTTLSQSMSGRRPTGVDDGSDPDRPVLITGPLTACAFAEPESECLESHDSHWSALLRTSFAAAREALQLEAEKFKLHKHDLATTLAVAVLCGWSLHCAQVGDGYFVVWDAENPEPGDARVLAHGAAPGRAANEVTPLTADSAMAELALGRTVLGPASRLLVSTDGIAPVLLDAWDPPSPSSRFLGRLSSEMDRGRLTPRSLDRMLDSQVVCDRTEDDKTVVLAQPFPFPTAG